MAARDIGSWRKALAEIYETQTREVTDTSRQICKGIIEKEAETYRELFVFLIL